MIVRKDLMKCCLDFNYCTDCEKCIFCNTEFLCDIAINHDDVKFLDILNMVKKELNDFANKIDISSFALGDDDE